MDTITIDLPGKFVEFFEGSSIVQENLAELEAYAGPSGLMLRAAWEAAQKITRGKGYSYRLNLTASADAVDLLKSYAEACLAGAVDNQEYAEADAARKMITRCDAALATLGAAR